MNIELLTLLINGERLKTLLTEDTLEAFHDEALVWQPAVTAAVGALAYPLSERDQSTVSALMRIVEEIQDKLPVLRQQIMHEQRQWIKANAAVHAYHTSGG